jgi:hypothetical protein
LPGFPTSINGEICWSSAVTRVNIAVGDKFLTGTLALNCLRSFQTNTEKDWREL